MLQVQQASITEIQSCIAELEEWKTDIDEVWMALWEHTWQLQEKIIDLEG